MLRITSVRWKFLSVALCLIARPKVLNFGPAEIRIESRAMKESIQVVLLYDIEIDEHNLGNTCAC